MSRHYNRSNETPDQLFKRDLASCEREQDFLKHLATLNTGSILLLVTFFGKLNLKPQWALLLSFALISFTISLLGCLVMQFLSVMHMDDTRDVDRKPNLFEWLAVLSGFGFFLLGMTALSAFVIRNLG